MAYRKTHWVDHVVQRPKTYTVTENSDGSKTFTDAPGEVVQQGTPMSATNFNNLEDGILHYSVAFDLLLTTSNAIIRDLTNRLEKAEEKLAQLAEAAVASE